ncbi:hypothetical protein Dip518_001462 [Parelusimicrobium proximum]|uniref:hypothetical protein n=1 Tax=Parelusimicrobium proximum TaxID=3228953 RepID=UPI003D17F5C0
MKRLSLFACFLILGAAAYAQSGVPVKLGVDALKVLARTSTKWSGAYTIAVHGGTVELQAGGTLLIRNNHGQEISSGTMLLTSEEKMFIDNISGISVKKQSELVRKYLPKGLDKKAYFADEFKKRKEVIEEAAAYYDGEAKALESAVYYSMTPESMLAISDYYATVSQQTLRRMPSLPEDFTSYNISHVTHAVERYRYLDVRQVVSVDYELDEAGSVKKTLLSDDSEKIFALDSGMEMLLGDIPASLLRKYNLIPKSQMSSKYTISGFEAAKPVKVWAVKLEQDIVLKQRNMPEITGIKGDYLIQFPNSVKTVVSESVFDSMYLAKPANRIFKLDEIYLQGLDDVALRKEMEYVLSFDGEKTLIKMYHEKALLSNAKLTKDSSENIDKVFKQKSNILGKTDKNGRYVRAYGGSYKALMLFSDTVIDGKLITAENVIISDQDGFKVIIPREEFEKLAGVRR